jgi:hypothetical protein
VAFGCMLSGIFWVSAMIYTRPGPTIHHSTTDFLVLQEPLSEALAEEGFDSSFIAYQTGEILRECGAWYFEVTPLYDDHMPTADLPIIPQNRDALQCVFLEADRKRIAVNIEPRWALDTHEIRSLSEGPSATSGQAGTK